MSQTSRCVSNVHQTVHHSTRHINNNTITTTIPIAIRFAFPRTDVNIDNNAALKRIAPSKDRHLREIQNDEKNEILLEISNRIQLRNYT